METLIGLLRGVAVETVLGLLRDVAVETVMGLLRGVAVETLMGLLRGVAGAVDGYGSGDDDGLLMGVAVETVMGLSVVRRIPMGGRMTLSFFVLQAIQCLPLGSDVSLELLLREISKDQKVEKFMSTGCSCTKWKGKSCSLQLTNDYV